MNYYIATKLTNFEEQKALAKFLKEKYLGGSLTLDWTTLGDVSDPSAPLPERVAEQFAAREIQAVKDADFLVAILPGGKGTHVELGAALSLHIPVIIYYDKEWVKKEDYTCLFYHHPLCKWVQKEEGFEAILDVINEFYSMYRLSK